MYWIGAMQGYSNANYISTCIVEGGFVNQKKFTQDAKKMVLEREGFNLESVVITIIQELSKEDYEDFVR